MCNYIIKQLNNVLKELNNERIAILSYDAETLFTIPGNNFGSLILNLVVEYTNESSDGEEKSSRRIVAKCIPESEDLRAIFQVEITFLKELEMYTKIIPALKAFQIEKGSSTVLDIFPDFYGGRVNLAGSGQVDEDGIILLENLKLSGYSNGERLLGLNYETTVSVLEDLAAFHAVPIALKIRDPQKFEESVMATLKLRLAPTDFNLTEFVNETGDFVGKNFSESVTKRVGMGLERGSKYHMSSSLPVREPFATLIHNDLWVNNILSKCEDHGVKNKVIDFQLIDYGSPARDVIFFLFSSVEIPTLKENYDKFVKVYHSKFLETLEELGCDTNPFSFTHFEFELSEVAKNCEFFHLFLMLGIFYSDNRDLKELKEWQGSDFQEMKVITEKYEEKAIFLIKEFVERKWI